MNALAKSQPWEQRLDEPDVCYHMFQRWLEQVPRNAPNDLGLAMQFDWATRAIAYDNAHAIPEDPGARAKDALNSVLATCAVEARKLLQRACESLEPQLTPRELAYLYMIATTTPQRLAAMPQEQTLQIDGTLTEATARELFEQLRKIH